MFFTPGVLPDMKSARGEFCVPFGGEFEGGGGVVEDIVFVGGGCGCIFGW